MTIKIDQAFISHFIAQDFGLPIAHENIDYTPSAGTAYAQLINAQNEDAPMSLADSNEGTGVFRVILRYPTNVGAVAAKQKADQIMAQFKIAQRIAYDGQSATILRHGREPGVAEDGWYKLVITFRYWAYVAR